MKTEDVQKLADEGLYLGRRIGGKLLETHISWVILTDKWAFKIKKPVKLSFLDYSALESRGHFCKEEILLNSRFSSIYIRCCPITWMEEKWVMDGKRGTVHDYAVLMKRLPEAFRMDKMLQDGKGSEALIDQLAKKVALFHRKQPAEDSPFDLNKAKGLFNDILNPTIRYTNSQRKFLEKAVRWSNAFLEAHSERFSERVRLGWVRDLHGDLHAGNVFLTDPPVLFDCIEFSKPIRTIDLLYEVAFLCMDLERYGKEDWSALFLETYLHRIPVLDSELDGPIFNYYKCLRANVRAKVLGLDPSDSTEKQEKQNAYFRLMEGYMQ
ncbi:phosphotransferase [Cyclobacterium jeungdonense]|uniref:Phosphotransferase n=1 Tax=Cyclobacterium jeungdonense TaxID=708087 RepID=A0ABT8CC92_9BACT|nr:phosphotransferase [Cyclobacterium jeungdonense]MDN3689433.1 phosphotransferase [Cyclobacterium jeungdonense]